MKKVIAILAITASLVACGSNNTVVVNADSTAVKADTTQVDSTKTVTPGVITKSVVK